MRAQISLELVLVIVVAFIAFAFLSLVAESGLNAQRNMSVQNQAKTIAHSTAQSLAALALFMDRESAQIKIPTQPILVLNPAFTETCKIKIHNAGPDSTVSVEFDWEGDATPDISITRNTIIPNGFIIPSEVDCNNTIIVTKT